MNQAKFTSHHELDSDSFDQRSMVSLMRATSSSKMTEKDACPFRSGRFKYDDFHTIDWLNDIGQDRCRHRVIQSRKQGSLLGTLGRQMDAGSGWLCVFFVGLATGCIAAVIDIGVNCFKDLRSGICLDQFWLNRKHCCWSYNETTTVDSKCPDWSDWSDFFAEGSSFPFQKTWAAYTFSFIFYVLWSLGFALLAGLLVKTFAPYACGSGVPEIKTILSGYIIRGYLGKWTLLIKSVSLILAVSSGLSLGKEGPLIHIACCVGNILAYIFPKYGKNEAKKREILSASAAAGVSVAFGAPIGGVLFSLEEVSYYFPPKTMWRSFFCALVAFFVLRTLYPFQEDHMMMFFVKYNKMWAFIELIPFALLGIIGGIIGTIYIKANIKLCRWRKETKLGRYNILEILIGTLLCTAGAYPNRLTRMYNADLIKSLIRDGGIIESFPFSGKSPDPVFLANSSYVVESKVKEPLVELALSFVFKLVVSIVTFGMKIPTGLFIPSMALGALYGRMVGILVEYISLKYRNVWIFKEACSWNKECFSPGIYAMIGAAAALGGVTRMTASLVVIMSELTGTVYYIVPLMTAIMASKWVGDAFSSGGIYDAHINLNQYPFLDNKDEFNHTTLAEDVLRGAPQLCVLFHDNMTVEEVEHMLAITPYNGFPVVTDTRTLVGFVLRNNLIFGLREARKSGKVVGLSLVVLTEQRKHGSIGPPPANLSHIVDSAPVTVSERTPMDTVIDLFRKMGLRQVCVTANGKLLGIITKKDVIRHIQSMAAIRRTSLLPL